MRNGSIPLGASFAESAARQQQVRERRTVMWYPQNVQISVNKGGIVPGHKTEIPIKGGESLKTQIKQMLKRFVSSVLSVSMLTPMLQAPSYAAAEVRIPEIEIDDGILTSDVFYLTAANAQLEEGSNARYLLRVARGGEADTDAGVTLKIADLTAKYGEDYTISLYGSGTNADSPKSNQSLLERIEGEAYTQSELRTEEEYSQMMEDDPDLREQTAAAIQQAVDYIEQASGLARKQTDDSERASGSEDGAEQEIPFADEEPSAEGDTAPQEEQTADGADGPETEPSDPNGRGRFRSRAFRTCGKGRFRSGSFRSHRR